MALLLERRGRIMALELKEIVMNICRLSLPRNPSDPTSFATFNKRERDGHAKRLNATCLAAGRLFDKILGPCTTPGNEFYFGDLVRALPSLCAYIACQSSEVNDTNREGNGNGDGASTSVVVSLHYLTRDLNMPGCNLPRELFVHGVRLIQRAAGLPVSDIRSRLGEPPSVPTTYVASTSYPMLFNETIFALMGKVRAACTTPGNEFYLGYPAPELYMLCAYVEAHPSEVKVITNGDGTGGGAGAGSATGLRFEFIPATGLRTGGVSQQTVINKSHGMTNEQFVRGVNIVQRAAGLPVTEINLLPRSPQAGALHPLGQQNYPGHIRAGTSAPPTWIALQLGALKQHPMLSVPPGLAHAPGPHNMLPMPQPQRPPSHSSPGAVTVASATNKSTPGSTPSVKGASAPRPNVNIRRASAEGAVAANEATMPATSKGVSTLTTANETSTFNAAAGSTPGPATPISDVSKRSGSPEAASEEGPNKKQRVESSDDKGKGKETGLSLAEENQSLRERNGVLENELGSVKNQLQSLRDQLQQVLAGTFRQ